MENSQVMLKVHYVGWAKRYDDAVPIGAHIHWNSRFPTVQPI